jgi:hypothetical protein
MKVVLLVVVAVSFTGARVNVFTYVVLTLL